MGYWYELVKLAGIMSSKWPCTCIIGIGVLGGFHHPYNTWKKKEIKERKKRKRSWVSNIVEVDNTIVCVETIHTTAE
jgi:hypothetical protein